MSETKLWLFDIEGTLTGPGGHGMALGLENALAVLRERGAQVGLVTGRELLYALVVHRLLNMDGPIVAESGCVWWELPMGEFSKGEVLATLTDEDKQQVRTAIRDAGLDKHVFEDWRKRCVSTWYPNAFPHHTREELKQAYDEVVAALPSDHNYIITYSSAAIDVTPNGVDKGSGVSALAERIHMPLTEMGYVGDGWNDWPGMERVLAGGGQALFVGVDPVLADKVRQAGGQVMATSGPEGIVVWVNSAS